MATAPDIKPAEEIAPLKLENFKINDVTSFWSPGDTVIECLDQAHALLLMLAAGEFVSDEAPPGADQLSSINERIRGRALEGIATLIAFAQFNNELFAEMRRR
jgi:hypothetical protein